MKTSSGMKVFGALFVLGLLAMSGCYTVLMHPSVLTSSERESTPPATSQGDFTSEISYDQNCLNCHSQAELDDRYYDMGRAGMHYAHGMSIDPYGWQRPATSLPWWDGVLAPIPSTASSSSIPSTAESGPRRRSSGVTRGGDRQRVSTTQSDLAPTSTTTSTAPATSPAVSDKRSSTSTSTQSTSTDRTRSTSAPPKEAAPRKAGSTRGDDP